MEWEVHVYAGSNVSTTPAHHSLIPRLFVGGLGTWLLLITNTLHNLASGGRNDGNVLPPYNNTTFHSPLAAYVQVCCITEHFVKSYGHFSHRAVVLD